ncbi:hypothetical protein ACFQAT_26395 [Undibacterium arcticum]|uniref:Uncharacterized protein n=1 Tax=Undibacterium arcticum TaxID=1762892 RepID=A0ABV7F8B9_9BURK
MAKRSSNVDQETLRLVGEGVARYRLKDMTEQFDAKAAEIRAMFSNQLKPKRTAEIRERMLAAGLPMSFAVSLSR